MKHNLSCRHAPSFNRLVPFIVKQVSPEKIYLLSAIVQRRSAESIFTSQVIESHQSSQYLILVVSGENEKRSNSILQQIIETQCCGVGIITAFVLPVRQFNTWLMNGHPFACRVYHTAPVYYDAGRVPLAIPNEYNPVDLQNGLTREFNRNAGLAIEFLSGAELFTIRKQFALAAFNLHQAAEQLYSGIILLTTGLRVQTHNLDKLYRYSMHLLKGLSDIFPRDSQQEKHLFTLLQKAYIESRYAKEYRIRPQEVDLLLGRVVRMVEVLQTVKYSPITPAVVGV